MAQAVSRKEFDDLRAEVEHLKENMAILSNPELLEKIQQAQSRMAKDGGVPLEKATRDLLGKDEL